MSENTSFPHPRKWSRIIWSAGSTSYPFPTVHTLLRSNADFKSATELKYPQYCDAFVFVHVVSCCSIGESISFEGTVTASTLSERLLAVVCPKLSVTMLFYAPHFYKSILNGR